MYKAERNNNIYSTKKYNLYICKICGHTEWVLIDEDIKDNFQCPFCQAPKRSFIRAGSEIFNNVLYDFIHIANGVFYIKQNPSFPPPFAHNSYFIEHKKGNILFDAPAFLNKNLFKEIEKRGELKYIIHSHNHFLGASRLLCERFLAQSWLGKEDEPIYGNYNFPDFWMMRDEHTLFDNLGEIIVKKFPGHTNGSYMMLIKRENNILLTGDSIYVNCSPKNKEENLFIFSDESPENLDWLYNLEINYIGSGTGFVSNAQIYLEKLKLSENPFGNPWNKKSKHSVQLEKNDVICAYN